MTTPQNPSINVSRALQVIEDIYKKKSELSPLTNPHHFRVYLDELKEVINSLAEQSTEKARTHDAHKFYDKEPSKESEVNYPTEEQKAIKQKVDLREMLYNRYGDCIIKRSTIDHILEDLEKEGYRISQGGQMNGEIEELSNIICDMDYMNMQSYEIACKLSEKGYSKQRPEPVVKGIDRDKLIKEIEEQHWSCDGTSGYSWSEEIADWMIAKFTAKKEDV